MGLRWICSVVELETPDANHKDDASQVACNACGGLKAIRTAQDSEDLGAYTADVMLGGASLQSYRFDAGQTVEMPEQYPGPTMSVPYPSDFDHLCLRYNREGSAHINVVAVEADTGTGNRDEMRIRPVHQPADGTDLACPIAHATLGGQTADLAKLFVWNDAAMTHIVQPASDNGGFHSEPGDGRGEFVFHAKPTLSVGNVAWHYQFVSWEQNLLSRTMVGTQSQWTGDASTYAFDSTTFSGIIAYYKRIAHDAETDKQYLPGKIDQGYPLPFREIVIGARAVFHRIEDLLEGRIAPKRHAPDTAAHGAPQPELAANDAERRRVADLARGGNATHAEVIALITQIHARQSD